jgi:predicted nucleotide-binding protein
MADKGGKGPKKQSTPRVQQTDLPSYTVEQALRVARALADDYAKQATAPLDVAVAMDMAPTSGPFKMITGASAAYGVTEGAARAETISLTPLGRRIVGPTIEGDDLIAKREALLQPRVPREFLQKYDGNPLPKRHIALNVIESLGVPSTAAERAYDLIMENGRDLGILQEHKGKTYVRLQGAGMPDPQNDNEWGDETDPGAEDQAEGFANGQPSPANPPATVDPLDLTKNKRVFITHGKNRKIVDQLKELLRFGDMEPVVSVENDTVAKPVPDKVLDDMRSCGAAIVHVGTETRLLDESGNEHLMLNPNVLIEIGAAMALYERRFVLLVEHGAKLPSNLQGLYEVRYEGGQLNYEATMKLLRSFNDFKRPAGS